MSGGSDETEGLEDREVALELPFLRLRRHARQQFAQREAGTAGTQDRQHNSLTIGEIVTDPLRRNVTAGSKADRDAAAGLLDLRTRKSGALGELRDSQRAATPRFDDAAAIEDARDQRVPWQRFVRFEESFRGDSEVERPRRRHLETIVVDPDRDRSARR